MPIHTIYYYKDNQNALLFAKLAKYGECKKIKRMDNQTDYCECQIYEPEKINS